MESKWAQSVVQRGDRWVRFVDTAQGYSAFFCLDTRRIHLFHDDGKRFLDAADDCGYLCISDLPSVIESMIGLQEQIEAVQSVTYSLDQTIRARE